jgi:gamma-glutamyltranspeptidase/glutathione hydrolase
MDHDKGSHTGDDVAFVDAWNSRRSTVYGTKGMCCCTQPLAAAAGNKILAQGGSAADAAVAMAACLNMLEPCSTGIGGDAFALYYTAATKEVSCFNGNGKSPAGFTMEALAERGIGLGPGQSAFDPHTGVAVTVPGAAQLWEDVVKTSGKLTFLQVLTPAIELGEQGFPLGPMSARQWSRGKLVGEEAMRTFRPNGMSPKVGELFYNRNLARTFREIAENGAKAFYTGRIAAAIVQASTAYGGMMTMEDLAKHKTNCSAPISTTYKGYRVYQTPPPSHGLATLIALNILEALPTPLSGHRSSAEQTHVSLECMRLALADALQYAADPEVVRVPVAGLLSKAYARTRAEKIDYSAASDVDFGSPETFMHSETVYFCCVDGEGNACSFINSNYMVS